MPHPSPVLLLFDIDGTILTAGGAGMRAMATVAARMFGNSFSWDGVESAGHLDPLIFAEAAANNKIENHHQLHQSFHDQYIHELAAELGRVPEQVVATPGIHECLQRMHRRAALKKDVVMGCLTGNYTKAVPVKLRAIGVDHDWFSITAFGDEAPTRPDLVALAMRKYEKAMGLAPDPRRVIIIGDTPRDVACAHAHGCVCLAVATGNYTLEELRAAKAEYVLPDLMDSSLLDELIDR